jgi:endonuclease III
MRKAEAIASVLEDMFPDAKAELLHNNPFELLVAVVLSAQTTDVAVNKVTPGLFQAYPTPEKMAQAEIHDLENHLRTIGLYRNKAKHIKALAKTIAEVHDNRVPSGRDALEALPGVGRKTANVVLSNAFGVPAFAVDTHVARVSVRLGLASPGSSVTEIEKALMTTFPKKQWQKLHHQMIFFGRYHCLAKSPKCGHCPLFKRCVFPQKTLFKGD